MGVACGFCLELSPREGESCGEGLRYELDRGVFDAMVERGHAQIRKRGLRLMVNIQEPNRLNGALLKRGKRVCLLPAAEPPALDLVKRYYGFNPEEVANLQPLQFIGRNLDTGGELRGQIML